MVGTSRVETRSKPRCVSENDMIATAAAITVVTATAPNAACSRTLMPNLPVFTPASLISQPRNCPLQSHCAGLTRHAKPGAPLNPHPEERGRQPECLEGWPKMMRPSFETRGPMDRAPQDEVFQVSSPTS